MTFFQRVFGGSKKEDPNLSSEQAIQRLASVEEVLIKKSEHLETQIEKEKGNAINFSRQGNKRGALNCLKKKKNYEKALLQVDGTLTTLESQREALQNAKSNMEVFHVMRQAAKAMEKANGGIDADTVHELKDQLDDQLSIADDIATAISSPGLSQRDGYNEDDLLQELDQLAQEDDQQQMIHIGPLPDVPINKINQKDNYQRELEEWVNN